MFGLGLWELIVIGLLLFVVFGAKRIPEIGKGLGGAVREFKNVKKEMGSGGDSKAGEGDKGKDGNGAGEQSLEQKMAGKILDQVPGVKRVRQAKKKVDKVLR
jgi:sec-independent protein translocase protein TatA